MKIQITLTVAGGKRLIARAVASLPQMAQALQSGRVLLVGGTTVSAVSEELGHVPLWISGRIDPSGTRTAGQDTHDTIPHTLLITQGRSENADTKEKAVIGSLVSGDLIVSGANVLLASGEITSPANFLPTLSAFPGVAALALAAPKGGTRAEALRLADERDVPIVIACGLEKYLPGKIDVIAAAADRAGTSLAMGAAIKLLPLRGQIITELEALHLLFGVEATVIAGGGILGGEGSRVFSVSGPEENCRQVIAYARTLVKAVSSGAAPSFIPCRPPCRHCGRHVSCVYLKEVSS